MNNLKRITTVLAVVYAYRDNKNIMVKYISDENLQPYVVGKDEAPYNVLKRAYDLQMDMTRTFSKDEIRKDNQLLTVLENRKHTTDTDWRALKTLYSTYIYTKDYNISNNGYTPSITIKDFDKTVDLYIPVEPDKIIDIFNNLFKKKKTNLIVRGSFITIEASEIASRINSIIAKNNKEIEKIAAIGREIDNTLFSKFGKTESDIQPYSLPLPTVDIMKRIETDYDYDEKPIKKPAKDKKQTKTTKKKTVKKQKFIEMDNQKDFEHFFSPCN